MLLARLEPTTSSRSHFAMPIASRPPSYFPNIAMISRYKPEQKSSIFRWLLRPRMQINASTTDTERFYTSKLSSQQWWLAESCQIVGFTNFQASQGKKFHQKLHISDDSKMCIHLCTAHLGLLRSAPQLQIVKHEKLEHVLDTIFWDIWAESVHCAMQIQPQNSWP